MSSRDYALEFLRQRPGESFTAREIAEHIIRLHPEWSKKKEAGRKNPRNSIEDQVSGEVSALSAQKRDRLAEQGVQVTGERPLLFCFNSSQPSGDDPVPPQHKALPEEKLYEPLCQYLFTEQNVRAYRIDERKSSNTRGKGSNHWRFPDIAGFRPISEGWNMRQRAIMERVGGSQIEFWSIEVKNELTMRDLRQSYFQAVSNSSWANLGYLAAPFDVGKKQMLDELRMLSDLHGIGFLRLEMSGEDDLQGEILFPARRKEHADWASLDRLAKENEDLMDLIKKVEGYLKMVDPT